MSDGARGRGRPKLSDTEKAARKAERDAKKGNGAAGPEIPTSDDRPAHEARNGKPHVAKEPLSDEQQHALTAHHTLAYEKAEAVKKKADADLKNTAKRAKAEGVTLAMIREYIAYQTPEGLEDLKEELDRKHKIARWAGAPVGHQFTFFEVDRVPMDDKVRDEGKRAALKGEKCEAPRTLPGSLISVWVDGWNSGHAVLASKIKPLNDAIETEGNA